MTHYTHYEKFGLYVIEDEDEDNEDVEMTSILRSTDPEDIERELLNKLIRKKYSRAWNYGNFGGTVSIEKIKAVKDELEDIEDENIFAANLLKKLESHRG